MKAQLEQPKIFNVAPCFYLFWNTKYYKNEPKYNGAYSRNNLSKVKDRSYITYLDESKSVGTHWVALYINAKNVIYFFEQLSIL